MDTNIDQALKGLKEHRDELARDIALLDEVIGRLQGMNGEGGGRVPKDAVTQRAIPAPTTESEEWSPASTPNRLSPEDKKTMFEMFKAEKSTAQIARHFAGKYTIQSVYNQKYAFNSRKK